MTVRSDITVDWSASPRIVELAAPAVAIMVQDIYDTLRSLSANATGICEPAIVEGGGKEGLGEGAAVGLTVTLLDALFRFAARGTWTSCAVKGGNLTAFNGGQYVFAIAPSAYVNVSVILSTSPALAEERELLMYVKSML